MDNGHHLLALRFAAMRATGRNKVVDQVRPSVALTANRAEVLRLAAEHGAHDVRVFGSVARGEDQPGSDVDLLVDFDAGTSLLTVIGLEQALSDLLGVAVDIGPADALRPDMRDRVLVEARTL